jgi:hypothetical protein
MERVLSSSPPRTRFVGFEDHNSRYQALAQNGTDSLIPSLPHGLYLARCLLWTLIRCSASPSFGFWGPIKPVKFVNQQSRTSN